jgi:hypothetical protein
VRAESASCVYRVTICKLINCNFRSRFSCYLSEDDDLRQNLERRQLCAQKAPRVCRVSISPVFFLPPKRRRWFAAKPGAAAAVRAESASCVPRAKW